MSLDDILDYHQECFDAVEMYKPEKICTEFSDFFKQFNNCNIGEEQEQMYDYLENESGYIHLPRGRGKTTFLITYIVYKAMNTDENWGIMVHDKSMDHYVYRSMHERFRYLTSEQLVKLGMDLDYFTHRNIFRTDKVITVNAYEFGREWGMSLKHIRDHYFNGFTRSKYRSRGTRKEYNIISDPIF